MSALYTGAALARLAHSEEKQPLPKGQYSPGRIPNEYSLLLPGEREALATEPLVDRIDAGAVAARVGKEQRSIWVGESLGGWELKAIADMNGTATAVFEKHVTHQGAILYVTESEQAILRIPKEDWQPLDNSASSHELSSWHPVQTPGALRSRTRRAGKLYS